MGSVTEVAALRDELPSWLESKRRIMTMLENLQVEPAATIHGQREVPPELEGRLRPLEREIARIRAVDRRES